jgi:DNA-binding CsgD family transcriptional regulator
MGYRAIDARPALESVQRALRGAGIRRSHWSPRSPRPQTGRESLSEAEARVARLVGSGHSNRAAAAELGLSANTVGSHLRSIFTKLELQSRVQLAHVMHAMVIHPRP